MKYNELPFSYRNYAQTYGWSEDQAREYWRQGEKYREFAIAAALSAANDAMLHPEQPAVSRMRQLVLSLRGTAAWFK